MSSASRLLRAVASLAFAAVLPAAAAAAPAKVVVGEVTGSTASLVEAAIRAALAKRGEVEVYPSDEWKEALATLDDDERGAAGELQIAAIVEGEVSRGKKGWTAVVRARAAGSAQAFKTWKPSAKELKKLTQQIEAGLWKELGGALLKAKPPKLPKTRRLVAASKATRDRGPVRGADDEGGEDPAEPTVPREVEPAAQDVQPQPEVRAQPSERRGGAYARNQVPLEAAIGFEVFARSFRYNDDLFGRLRPYALGGAPAAALKLAWYPGAHFTSGLAAHLGVGVEAAYALGLESSDSSGAKFPTSALSIVGALRGRMPLGEASEVVVGLGAGRQGFAVSSSDRGGAGPDFPSVAYTFGRAGAELRLALGERLSLMAAFGWRQIFSAGEVQGDAWFPRAVVGGLDGAVAVGWSFTDALELRLGGAGQHYFYAMKPEPGDPNIAGGAVDQYLGGSVSMAWTPR